MNDPRSGACPGEVERLLHRIGLLDEEESERIGRHAASCPRCFAGGEAGASVAPGHVPPGILARWPGVRDALPEPARVAVEAHFARCAECSEDLATLARIREATLEPLGAEGEVRRAPRRRGFALLGGYAALATAAAIVFALRGPLVSAPPSAPTHPPKTEVAPPPPSTGELRPELPGETSPPPATGPREPAPRVLPSPPAWQLRLLPREPRLLPSVLRSGAGTLPTVPRGPDAGALVVRIEPQLPIPDDAAVTVELRGAEDRLLARSRARWADFHGGGTILLARDGTDLPAGSYVLRVRARVDAATGDAGEEIIDYPFRVEGRE